MGFLLFDLAANELANASTLAISEIYEKLEQPPNSEMLEY